MSSMSWANGMALPLTGRVDEKELHHEVMRAELAYGMHSKEKELAAVLSSLQEGATE